MTDLSVTERRLRPILDAVASRNWKQALQQCDKWQKKGEKSDRFLALKASILINQPDKSHFEKGKAETLELCHRSSAVTDIEALYQLQDSLKHLSLHHEEGPRLWERAIAARPNDKDLLITLINGSISDGEWMSAQKAAMALRKAHPKERQYDFWNMLLCYLIHQDQSITQKDRDLFGRLAFMLMSKAADAVPTTKDEVLSTGKAVSTPEELCLLVKIYIATNHSEQAVKVMQGDTLGLRSRIAELDPSFAFSLYLEALNAHTDQKEVFDICKFLVESGSAVSKEHLEDDRVWNLLVNSGGKTESSASLEIARSVYQSDPKCRAAYLAYFDIAIRQSVSPDEQDRQALTSACTSYYNVFCGKPFCFGDLVRPLQSSSAVLQAFRKQTELEKGDVLQRTIYLKLQHASLDSTSHPATENEYFEIAANAMKLHKELPEEKSECPEMLLLAATALLRLSLKTKEDNYAFQAGFILQMCDTKFNEYYPVAIRQIQLYLTQGQISLAMERFASLAVKNMQWETVGHLLLTRMSTIHPWQAEGSFESSNPLAALDSALTMMENAERSLDKAIQEGMKYGSYSNIIDSVKVKDNMSKSMNRQIFTVEERRIQRIVGAPQDAVLDPYPANMVDQRDFSFLPDFGNHEGRTPLEQSLSCGPLPTKPWLSTMALQDHLTTYLRAELSSQLPQAGLAIDRLKTAVSKTNQHDADWSLELTEAEAHSLKCHNLLTEALLLTKEPSSEKQQAFDTLVNDIKSWLNVTTSQPVTGITTINKIETPTWQFLHTSFTQLETLQTTSLFLSLQARRTKTVKAGKAIVLAKDKLTELQQLVVEAEKAVHARAKKVKDGLNVSGVLSALVDAAAGRIEGGSVAAHEQHKALASEFEQLIDEVALEEYCGRIKESWEDALDGILRTKVRVVK